MNYTELFMESYARACQADPGLERLEFLGDCLFDFVTYDDAMDGFLAAMSEFAAAEKK